MEFIKYIDLASGKEKEDRTMPRVGTLHVSGDFDGSDNNIYPNHEVFGRCRGGSYPLYAKYTVEWEGVRIQAVHNDGVFADIPGASNDGKGGFLHPFRIYCYEIGDYLGGGKEERGVKFRIELDEPFHFDHNEKYVGLQGFDIAWLDPLNMSHKDFPNLDEAKEAAFEGNIGKSGVAVTNVAGRKTILVGSDCAYDGVWSALHEALMNLAPAAKPNGDLAVDEASRLRDEFIESLKRVCGAEVEKAFDEF